MSSVKLANCFEERLKLNEGGGEFDVAVTLSSPLARWEVRIWVSVSPLHGSGIPCWEKARPLILDLGRHDIIHIEEGGVRWNAY